MLKSKSYIMLKNKSNLTEKTDRELTEMQVELLSNILKKQKGIKDNLDFFFWVTIVGVVIVIVKFFMS